MEQQGAQPSEVPPPEESDRRAHFEHYESDRSRAHSQAPPDQEADRDSSADESQYRDLRRLDSMGFKVAGRADFIDEVSEGISSYLALLEAGRRARVYDRSAGEEGVLWHDCLRELYSGANLRAYDARMAESERDPEGASMGSSSNPSGSARGSKDRPDRSLDDFLGNCPPPKDVPFQEPATLTDGKPRLAFSACFESGNLAMAESDHPTHYKLHIDHDVNTHGYTQWFYFGVRGGYKGQFVRFLLVNLKKAGSLFARGMRPVVWSERSDKGWQRGGNDIRYCATNPRKKKGYHTLAFSYTFEHDGDTVFFAYSYPYTYTYLQEFLTALKMHPFAGQLVQREVLCKTIGGVDCDIIHVAKPSGDGAGEGSQQRPLAVVTGRVHPGESNASWMVHGFLQFLLCRTPEAEALREAFDWMVIPMLNPDGVIQGNYRCGLAGVDLNRVYDQPHKKLHPTIWHLKQRLKERHTDLYIDFHGHSKKEGIFWYGGCAYGEESESKNSLIRLLPRMCCVGSDDFAWRNCSFNTTESKLSTARLMAFMDLGVQYAYTVEASFYCGAKVDKPDGDDTEAERADDERPELSNCGGSDAGGSDGEASGSNVGDVLSNCGDASGPQSNNTSRVPSRNPSRLPSKDACSKEDQREAAAAVQAPQCSQEQVAAVAADALKAVPVAPPRGRHEGLVIQRQTSLCSFDSGGPPRQHLRARSKDSVTICASDSLDSLHDVAAEGARRRSFTCGGRLQQDSPKEREEQLMPRRPSLPPPAATGRRPSMEIRLRLQQDGAQEPEELLPIRPSLPPPTERGRRPSLPNLGAGADEELQRRPTIEIRPPDGPPPSSPSGMQRPPLSPMPLSPSGLLEHFNRTRPRRSVEPRVSLELPSDARELNPARLLIVGPTIGRAIIAAWQVEVKERDSTWTTSGMSLLDEAGEGARWAHLHFDRLTKDVADVELVNLGRLGARGEDSGSESQPEVDSKSAEELLKIHKRILAKLRKRKEERTKEEEPAPIQYRTVVAFGTVMKIPIKQELPDPAKSRVGEPSPTRQSRIDTGRNRSASKSREASPMSRMMSDANPPRSRLRPKLGRDRAQTDNGPDDDFQKSWCEWDDDGASEAQYDRQRLNSTHSAQVSGIHDNEVQHVGRSRGASCVPVMQQQKLQSRLQQQWQQQGHLQVQVHMQQQKQKHSNSSAVEEFQDDDLAQLSYAQNRAYSHQSHKSEYSQLSEVSEKWDPQEQSELCSLRHGVQQASSMPSQAQRGAPQHQQSPHLAEAGRKELASVMAPLRQRARFGPGMPGAEEAGMAATPRDGLPVGPPANAAQGILQSIKAMCAPDLAPISPKLPQSPFGRRPSDQQRRPSTARDPTDARAAEPQQQQQQQQRVAGVTAAPFVGKSFSEQPVRAEVRGAPPAAGKSLMQRRNIGIYRGPRAPADQGADGESPQMSQDASGTCASQRPPSQRPLLVQMARDRCTAAARPPHIQTGGGVSGRRCEDSPAESTAASVTSSKTPSPQGSAAPILPRPRSAAETKRGVVSAGKQFQRWHMEQAGAQHLKTQHQVQDPQAPEPKRQTPEAQPGAGRFGGDPERLPGAPRARPSPAPQQCSVEKASSLPAGEGMAIVANATGQSFQVTAGGGRSCAGTGRHR